MCRKYLLIAVFLFTACYGFAQQKISGKVSDQNGKPLAGVSVALKNTQRGTFTNAAGSFEINGQGKSDTLIFSFLGFGQEEVAVKGIQPVSVTLIEKGKDLDQVIVIGYGQVRKKDLTGSVGSVDVESMQKAPVRSFEEALAGRVAGVQVSSNDGQPGAASNIVIRGNNSLTQDNSPLYVIDGFPVENPDNNAINPSDIESIDILKDASATAIYGARGANGVIIITTKRGKNAAPTINFDAYFGNNSVIKKQDLLSPYEFVRLMKEIYPAYTDTTYLENATLENYRGVKAIDWQDEVLHNAPFSNYSMAIRGGNTTTNYSVSFSMTDQQGAVINSGFKRYQGRIVLDQKINEKLKAGVNINYNRSKSYGLYLANYGGNDRSNAFLSSVWGYRPLAGSIGDPNFDENNSDLVDDDIDPSVNTASDYRYNPLSTAKNTVNDRFTNSLFANAYLQYSFTKELIFKISGGFTSDVTKTNQFYNSHTRQGDKRIGGTGPYGSIDNVERTNYVNENTLNYRKSIHNLHWIDALFGFTVQGYDYTAYGTTGGAVPNESLGVYGIDEGSPVGVRSSNSVNKLASFLGRVNYNYKSTYYITASYRADGSSKFSPDNHWSFFPSAAVSWRLTNEKFMAPVKSVVNDAKIRLGYGVTGNNRVTDYPYLSAITLPIVNNYSFGGAYSSGANLSSLGNKDLKWETTSQANAGVDLELYKGRIALVVDYYYKKTYDLLLNAPLPGSSGFSSAFANIGKVRNAGWEFTINTNNIKKSNFNWTSSFNISFNRSKVLELVEGQESLLSSVSWSKNGFGSAPAYIAKIGQPVSLMYGYVFDGLYQYTDFNKTSTGAYVLKDAVPDNGSTRSTIQPGYVKFRDLNGDGVLNSKDQTAIGRPYPIHTGGFSNNFRYKNFDLNVFFQWSYGNQAINANRYVFEGELALNRNMFASYANRWSDANQKSDIPAVRGLGPYVYSSRVIEDASYLRLKTVQLGYTVPASVLKKAGIKSIRVYASSQNLITWTNYSGMDPEVSAYNSALTPGFDYSAYPRARTVTFGINMTL